jgi:predicted Zn-dependent peptidase
MILAAAGKVDHDKLVRVAEKRFTELDPTSKSTPEAARYIGGEERFPTEHEQAHIVIGLEGRPYNSNGFYTVQILSSILGGGMSSRLFQEVREKRGLCYSVYAFHWAFADSGVFGVAAATGGNEVGELVNVVLDELRRAADTITEEEVVRVRNQIRAGLLMSLENPSARAGQIARQQILWGRTIPLDETVERINRIDANRVKQVAHQLFDTKRVSVAGIGPVGSLPDHDSVVLRLRA